MGFPLSTYPLLWSLADSGRTGHGSARRALKGFHAAVIVVASPTLHAPVVEAVSGENFVRLHHSTGGVLFFFAPVQPPPTWKPTEQQIGAVSVTIKDGRHYGRFEDRELDLPIVTANNMEAVHLAVAGLLKCPDADEPWLYVTRDLASNQGYWVPTGADLVEDQIGILTRALRSGPEGLEGGLKRAAGIAIIDSFSDGAVLQSLKSPIAGSLAAVAGAALVQRWGPEGDSARNTLTREIRGLLRQGARRNHRLMNDFQEELPLEEEEQAKRTEALMTAAALKMIPSAVEVSSWGMQLDPLSNSYLAWADELSRGEDEVGKLLAATCYVTAVERHLVSSLVHLIREAMKVSLPKYYRKYDSGAGLCAVEVSSKFLVAFNAFTPGHYSNRWRAPTLGQIKAVVGKLIRSSNAPQELIFLLQNLSPFEAWEDWLFALEALISTRNHVQHGMGELARDEIVLLERNVQTILAHECLVNASARTAHWWV